VLIIAHTIPGAEFTIEVQADVGSSAHEALGFSDAMRFWAKQFPRISGRCDD